MTILHRNRSGFRESAADRAFGIVNAILLIVIAFTMVYPLYFVIVASFSDPFDVVNGRVFLWVRNFTTESYGYVFNNSLLWSGYGNSIVNTICAVAYNLGILIPAAYVLSRQDLPGRSFFNLLFLVTMFFGGGMVPTYMMVKWTGLINTRWALILPSLIGTWNMFMMRNFFYAIPESLIESAELDGANQWQILTRIVLPCSLASIATILLFYAVGHWNSWFDALLYISDNKLLPMQNLLRNIIAASNMSDLDASAMLTADYVRPPAESIKSATIVVTTLPILVVYPFIQKYFVKGVMVGSVKG